MGPTRALCHGRFCTARLGVRALRMFTRRLDDRIRFLCAQVSSASSEELEAILQELLSAIHEKIERLRGLATGQLLGGAPPKERRTLRP